MSAALDPSFPVVAASPAPPRLEGIPGYSAYESGSPPEEQDFALRAALASRLREVSTRARESIRRLGPEALPDILNYATRLSRTIALFAERMEEGPLRAGRRGHSPFRAGRLAEIRTLDLRLADAVGRTEEAVESWGPGRAKREEWIARFVALEAQVGEVLGILARREQSLAR